MTDAVMFVVLGSWVVVSFMGWAYQLGRTHEARLHEVHDIP